MTPAAIALAALCGVLALLLWWLTSCMKHDRKQFAFILDTHFNQIKVLRETRAELMEQSEKDSTLIAEAHALLHDERHKGKMDNQRQWQAARAEWAGKVGAR
jgi:hypothetical protein